MANIDTFVENPALRELHNRQRALILNQFPDINACQHQNFLYIIKYIKEIPHKFYNYRVYEEFLQWLFDRDKNNRDSLKKYLSHYNSEIDSAFLHMGEVNLYKWHDKFDKIDDYEIIRFIDQEIHPAYLRVTEAVLYPFLRVVAYFSRIDRSKGTDGLDLWSVINEIRGRYFGDVIKSYHHIVRNGIGHGGVTYLEKSIRYKDKAGNEEEFDDSAVIRMCDDLVDSCNALALALSIFLLIRQIDGYELPRQLLVEELREETRSPWWEIAGCVPSRFSDVSQLIVYARSQTLDSQKVLMSTFQSGVLVARFAPGFDRYFFSIRSNKGGVGFASFNATKLNFLCDNDKPLDEYVGVVEDFFYYVPWYRFPKIFSRIGTLIAIFKIFKPFLIDDFRNNLGLADIIVRNVEIHRNSWGCVLNGSVVICCLDESISQDVIRRSCRRIVNKALSRARRQNSRLSWARYLPVGFARIAVFQTDRRMRYLVGYGLGEDLVCTIQIQRLQRISSPDIIGSTIETHGRYRIAWNQAWLQNQ